MAQRIINIGTLPNDRSGDPLRVAFEKINSNFTELFNGVLLAASVDGGGAPTVYSVSELNIDGGVASTVYGPNDFNLNGGGA